MFKNSKTKWASTALTVALASTLGCSRGTVQEKSPTVTEVQALAQAKSGAKEQAAETYARIGELLLSGDGITYAGGMFDKALAEDSSNRKAIFYSAFTDLLPLIQGFHSQAQSFLTAEEKAKIEKVRARWIQSGYTEAVAAFFGEPVRGGNEQTAQAFIAKKVVPVIVSSIAKIERVEKLGGVELSIPQANLEFSKPKTVQVCFGGSYPDSSGNYSSYWSCTETRSNRSGPKDKQITVDAADLKVIKTYMRSILTSAKLATAYDLGGAATVAHQISGAQKKGKKLTDRQIVNLIRAQADLGQLVDRDAILTIRDQYEQIAEDTIALEESSDLLCKNEDRRQGNFLIDSICVEIDFANRARTLLDLLKGVTSIPVCSQASGPMLRVDLPRLLANPVTDLKTQLPTRFDRAGKAMEASDPTFGGLFPDGDLIEALKACR